LSGLDAGFLYLEASGTPMHVGSLMLLAPPKRRAYDFHHALQALIAESLPKARALKRILIDAPLELAHPMWGEAAHIDLEQHIRREQLPRPGGMAQLLRRCAELHADMLPRDRPLWRLVVIEGLASGEVALYSKIHHALLDGQGGIALAQALLELQPRIPKAAKEIEVVSAEPLPGTRARAGTAARATVSQFARLIRAVPATLRLAGNVLGEAGLIGTAESTVTVLVTQMDAGLMPVYLDIATQLRNAGINTELVLDSAKLGKQLKYASKAGIRFAVIVGENEVAKSVVMVKDLAKEEQFEVPRGELIKALRVEIEQAEALGELRRRGAVKEAQA